MNKENLEHYIQPLIHIVTKDGPDFVNLFKHDPLLGPEAFQWPESGHGIPPHVQIPWSDVAAIFLEVIDDLSSCPLGNRNP